MVTCLTVIPGEVAFTYASAFIHIEHPVSRAVFSAYESDINFVCEATVAAFITVKALALSVEAHPVARAVRQKAVDCSAGAEQGRAGRQRGRETQRNQR